MARKQQKIKCISYVRVGGELVETSKLSPEQKERLATWLKVTYLNALFAGRAEFSVATEPSCADQKEGGEEENGEG